jgi:hypothetical protein
MPESTTTTNQDIQDWDRTPSSPCVLDHGIGGLKIAWQTICSLRLSLVLVGGSLLSIGSS